MNTEHSTKHRTASLKHLKHGDTQQLLAGFYLVFHIKDGQPERTITDVNGPFGGAVAAVCVVVNDQVTTAARRSTGSSAARSAPSSPAPSSPTVPT